MQGNIYPPNEVEPALNCSVHRSLLLGGLIVTEHIKKTDQPICLFNMVREKGLEPSRPEALAPKASVSTNSTTRAYATTTIANISHFAKSIFRHILLVVSYKK